MSALWAVHAPSMLRLRSWDDEVAVYDDACAATHLLEGDVAAVFGILASQPDHGFSDSQLLTELGESASDEDSRQRLRDILTSLQQSGLAESRAP